MGVDVTDRIVIVWVGRIVIVKFRAVFHIVIVLLGCGTLGVIL
jgi:hypothetical protein